MKSLPKILSNSHYSIPQCHLTRALQLHQQLRHGVPYTYLGGVRLRQNPQLVRFKIGRNFRLLYKIVGLSIQPYQFISRQKFKKTIKRRCK